MWPRTGSLTVETIANLALTTDSPAFTQRSWVCDGHAVVFPGAGSGGEAITGVEISFDQGVSWWPLFVGAQFPVTRRTVYWLRRIAGATGTTFQIAIFGDQQDPAQASSSAAAIAIAAAAGAGGADLELRNRFGAGRARTYTTADIAAAGDPDTTLLAASAGQVPVIDFLQCYLTDGSPAADVLVTLRDGGVGGTIVWRGIWGAGAARGDVIEIPPVSLYEGTTGNAMTLEGAALPAGVGCTINSSGFYRTP